MRWSSTSVIECCYSAWANKVSAVLKLIRETQPKYQVQSVGSPKFNLRKRVRLYHVVANLGNGSVAATRCDVRSSSSLLYINVRRRRRRLQRRPYN